MPETSSDESVKEVIVPLGAEASLSCEASSALMRSSATSPSVTYSWSKYQDNMAKDVVMQGVRVSFSIITRSAEQSFLITVECES